MKRHKLWAQCNGARNPAAYKKRSELATSAGIDHDYNYLTSIEREFDKAEKEASIRGLVLDESQQQERLTKGEKKLRAAYERIMIIVAKAPKGMSREKNNGTRWRNDLGCLEWTIEWVHANGKRQLSRTRDNLPVAEAYEAVLHPRVYKKRKRKAEDATEEIPGKIVGPSQSRNVTLPDVKTEDFKNGKENDSHNQPSETPTDKPPETEESSETAMEKEVQANGTTPLAKEPTLSFYLHTPSLPSRHPVLAPLEADTNLSTALRNRLVLEYPTIYIFNQMPDEPLPDGYLTEQQYYDMSIKERFGDLDEGEIVEDVGNEGDLEDPASLVKKLDERKLLEVLEKDIGS